jgi:hypothetical protein
MATTIPVKLTPVDPSTGLYDLELPDQLAMRLASVERPTKAELLTTLIQNEIGTDLGTPALRVQLSDGNYYKVDLVLDN